MIKVVLMDIEGTTTSIDFVHKVLFPYAHEHMEEFISHQGKTSQIESLLDDTRNLSGLDSKAPAAEVIAVLKQWIKSDKKTTPLKTLQGYIWKEGYAKGHLKSHIYPEVSSEVNKWHERKLQLGIYSSGSIEAQKQLFQHTPAGDLTKILKFHFDTTSGHKREVQSYKNILDSIGCNIPEEVLFLSDVAEELDAARLAGMQTTQLVRAEDRTEPNSSGHPVCSNFNEVSHQVLKLH